MISNLLKSLRLTIAFCLFPGIFHIFILWLFAQVAGPNKGSAKLVTLNGEAVGTANIDQNFAQDIYFWGRPSHTGDGYDASSSASSNKGPSNEEHLALLEERIDTLLIRRSYLTREEVPVEVIIVSSSGLDPRVSPKAAYAQAKRVTGTRGWSEEKVMGIVDSHIGRPLLGMFETERVSVSGLNVALDQASNSE